MQESPLTIRLTKPEDAPHLMQWLSDPKILRWFPMYDARGLGGCHAIGDLNRLINECMNAVCGRDWGTLDQLHHQVIRTDVV